MQNTNFTPDKVYTEQFDIWITFQCHHIHELQTVQNGPVIMT